MAKDKGGRPKRWNTPEELQADITTYLNDCEEKEKMPTKAGLLLHLDITDETFRNYKKKGGGFLGALKKAHSHIEEAWNQALRGSNAAGPIFYLKAAFHYKDRMDFTSNDKDIALSPEKQKAIDELLENE